MNSTCRAAIRHGWKARTTPSYNALLCATRPFGSIHYNSCRSIPSISACLETRPEIPGGYVWTVTNKLRYLSTEAKNDLEGVNQLLMDCADSGDAKQANELFVRLEKQALENDVKLNVDSYTAVLDAWLAYQQDISQQLDQLDDCEERQGLLQEMYHAAECANAILNRMQTKQQVGPEEQETLSKTSVQPSSHHYDAVLLAWNRLCVLGGVSDSEVTTKGAPQRAQRVLEQMESEFLDASSEVKPSIMSYNLVMEAWGTSGEHLRGSMAQSICNKLVTEGVNSPHALGGFTGGVEPNAATHRIMIRAWCRSKQKRSAFNATGHLMKLQQGIENGVVEMEPTLDDYHTVLEAWKRAEGKLGYRRALSLLRIMDELYDSKVTEIRPTETTFRLVLETVAHNSVTVPDLGQWVDKLLNQMEERVMIPDTTCFGAAIETYKNSALLNQQSSSLRLVAHEDAVRAHELLKQMKMAFHRTSTIVVKPCAKHYNMVLQAWSMSDDEEASRKAERLLLEMERLYHAGDEDMKPNFDSYIWTLDSLAKSRSVDNVERSLAVFERLKKIQNTSDPNDKPSTKSKIVDVHNAMMNVCSSARRARGDATGRQDLLETAFTVFSDLTTTSGEESDVIGVHDNGPNSATYRILLKACANHLSPGKEQLHALTRVFENCCRAGVVDKGVLETFKQSVTSDVYNKVVVAAGVGSDASTSTSAKVVPEEWTRNLSYRYRVLTVDGHKPPPLSIDGSFVFTPAMYENKMRNLRKRKNQRLLRGGRLR